MTNISNGGNNHTDDYQRNSKSQELAKDAIEGQKYSYHPLGQHATQGNTQSNSNNNTWQKPKTKLLQNNIDY
jgi:hypothetical protein